MYCRSVNINYRNTNTTIYIVLVFLFIVWFFNLLLPLDLVFDNKYYILISYLILSVIEYWKHHYDPTEMCAYIFQTNCKKRKFMFNMFGVMAVSIPFVFFALQAIIKDLTTCVLITLVITIIKISSLYFTYKQDDKKIINSKTNPFFCQRTRIVWNVILLLIQTFMFYKSLKEFNVKSVLQNVFKFNNIVSYVLSGIYLVVVIGFPFFVNINRVDQSVKYRLDEINLT
jgi:hypothetical protein